MEIVFLGTGCPAVSTERYGPAQLVLADGAKILVDCGSGVTQRLVAAGTPGRALDALLLTHLHSDHLVDLYQLIVSSWTVWRDRPLPVFGPPGTKRYVEGLMALWEPELSLRIAHEKRPSTAALETEVTEIAPGQTLTFGRTSVDVIEVDHQPVRHAFGFLFRSGELTLAVSGDTRRCQALIEAAVGADLLVHEVFVHRELGGPPGVDWAETVANLASYHTLSSEVGKIATDAGVKALALRPPSRLTTATRSRPTGRRSVPTGARPAEPHRGRPPTAVAAHGATERAFQEADLRRAAARPVRPADLEPGLQRLATAETVRTIRPRRCRPRS